MKNRISYPILSFFLLCALMFSTTNISAQKTKEKSPVVTLTAANYESEIKKGLVFVDFWAVWCGPCKRIAPILDEIAKEHKDLVKIGKVNVDNYKKFSIDKGVQALPTIIVYKDGKEVTRILGLTSKEKLVDVIAQHSDSEQKEKKLTNPVESKIRNYSL